jgi:hypothetical protein
VLSYLAAAAFLPVSHVALIVLALLTLVVSESDRSFLGKALLLGSSALLLVLMHHVGWGYLGESAARRYGAVAILIVLTVLTVPWYLKRSTLDTKARQFVFLSIVLSLLFFPFTSIKLPATAADLQGGFSLAVLAGTVWLARRLGASALSQAVAVTSAAFLSWPTDGYLVAMLAAHAVSLVVSLRKGRDDDWAGIYLTTTSCLMGLSGPAVAGSVGLMLVVPLAFHRWQPARHHVARGIAMFAILLTSLRYSLFDLYGYVDSPALAYGLKHLDLASAYVGDSTPGALRAVFMVVLKVWLTSAALVSLLYVTPYWRRWSSAIAVCVALFLLFNVTQTSLRVLLSIDSLSARYDIFIFSLAVHGAIFLIMLLAYLSLGGWRGRSLNPSLATGST